MLFTLLLVRVVLPAALLLSLALRPFGLSMVYLLLYFIAPLVQVPEKQAFNGFRSKFLLLIVIASSFLLLCHVVWHSVLAFYQPYGSILEGYPLVEQIGHNLGLVSYAKINRLMALHYLAPELIMSALSLWMYIVVSKLVRQTPGERMQKKDTRHQQYPGLTRAGKYFCLFLIMFSGILRPSIMSGIYYLVFMGAATAWAVGQPLEKGFAVVSRCLMAIMAVHVTTLGAYQNSWLMTLYPPTDDLARYFGLTKLVNINDTDPTSFTYATDKYLWATPTSPLVILITYFILAIQARELFKPKAEKETSPTVESGKSNGSIGRSLSFHRASRRAIERWKSASRKSQVAYSYIDTSTLRGGNDTETTPLMQTGTPSNRFSSVVSRSRTLRQDSTGSIVVPDEDYPNDASESTMGHIAAAIIDFFQVLVRSSYVATTIVMMAWSIMFHSWLTFVFLMWANVVWLRQDQRSFMLKTSPLLVCYAMFLLLAQYVYSMDLLETELPSNMLNVNLHQIGFGRSDGVPCVPLLIKSLFTCVLWVTLRQRVQDIRMLRQSHDAKMASHLQLTVSAATGKIDQKRMDEDRSYLMQSLGAWLRTFCARYWIYVVVIMLFVIGVTGDRMTIFRIIYMFFFLTFILMFQISWYWWRRLMYVFWIVLITYSMLNLILIYVYQFDNFSKIIETYLLIDEVLQHDLGLDTYHPADLFIKLLTPTLFVIITIMQVHYFHKDFMALSDLKNTDTNVAESSRPSQGNVSTTKDDIPPLPLENDNPNDGDQKSETEADHSLGASSRNTTGRQSFMRKSSRSRSNMGTTEQISLTFRALVARTFTNACVKFHQWRERTFQYLDIHLVRIVFLALMLLCLINVCAMHVPIMFIIPPALLLSSSKQRLVILCISTLISFYFMIKMVYQIKYIDHSMLRTNCSIGENNTVVILNNAEWFGLKKATPGEPLVDIVKGYIGLIVLFTFYSLVKYRQDAIRARQEPGNRKDRLIMFPGVQRVDADKDLTHCIKYLFNYGFYKFGVEITLICLVGVIGSRMDVYAALYSIWLLVLVSMNRKNLARIWLPFTIYVTFLIPLQYMIAVGTLPHFCIDYPWSSNDAQMRHIRSWFYLPNTIKPPHGIKLIFDCLLLFFASRQLRVFNIERKRGDSYPGGSNSEDIGKDWESTEFVNPVPDFMNCVGSWLDLIKRMIFLGMLWVTLAIMFMTGTNRVNLFSMGYLIGSFIFLWQGTDFYLRPKHAIMKWWAWLLRYNVCVVVIKAFLQIPGCMYSTVLQDHACWLVQLLGIGCVDKFAGGNIAQFIKMSYVKDACSVPQEDIGLAWDGVCFAFLIIQRRLFHSYYFYRVIDESKATTILASRGADLIEELRQKQMQIQEKQETKILEKIKGKMERIKAYQKKVQGSLTKEPPHHDSEEEDDDDTQPQTEGAPLERGDSQTSGRGFHTPDSPASPRGFHTPLSERSAPPTPPPAPLPQPPALPGPPSPSSALMTVSLDAYLEPRRISFGSPPSSDLVPRTRSPEESYPVFSPPPIRRRHTVASPSIVQQTSIISQSSRAGPLSHHTSRPRPQYKPPSSHQKAVRSGDYYMFDDEEIFDDTEMSNESESESESENNIARRMGIGQLLATAFKGELKRAVSLRRASMPTVKPERRRSLASLPYSYPSNKVQRVPSQIRLTDAPSEHDSDSELEEFASMHEKETLMDKLRGVKDIIWAFISSILVSLTRHLMKYSRDYRYVSRTLSIEKKILKEKEGFGIGVREGLQMIWEPFPDSLVIHRKLSDISVPEIRILAPSMERGLDASPDSKRAASPISVKSDDTSEHESAFSLQTTGSKDVSVLEEHDDSMFKKERSLFVHLAYALWYAVIAHTDIVCYIMVFINQIQSATILSIPLPLMVFLWGTLTIPRPTKTFWVTLIAYTEVIVLIKSMFQFEILPWNQKAIPKDMPFTAPRIIGIERKYNYALYDLLLLLIIFFHRFMLKSLGLWKESSPETKLRTDTEYQLTKEDHQMLVEGNLSDVGRKYLTLHEKNLPAERNNEETNNTDEEDNIEAVEKELKSIELSKLEEPGPSKTPDNSSSDNIKFEYDEPVIAVTSTQENKYENYPKVMLLALKRYLEPSRNFFRRMLAPGARVTADVYAYMFLCDFFNFLVVIFGFAAFGTHQGDGGVQTYLEENKVPIAFLVMLILQFVLIIIDRALYLRKFIMGKIMFQYALVIGVHVWMFFVLPFITERTFNALLPPPTWYMIKCIYLLLSAYQIRCGYPRRIIGNFLCKSYRFINMVLFRGFMAVPFVFELRTLMDWIWTDTSMTLLDWLKMEDIFASVFLLKCSRNIDDEFPQPRGVKKANISKYLLGGGVLAFVISIIWFPLVFFAFGDSVGEPNPPTDVTVKIRIGPFLPVYQMSAQSHNIAIFTEQDYNQLSNLYARDRNVQTFLSNYMYNDVAVITINPNSTMRWEISPPELERLEREAKSNATIMVQFKFVITHPTNAVPNPPSIVDHREVPLHAYINDTKNPERDKLLNLLDDTATVDTWLNVKTLFPKFLKVFNKGTAKPAYQLIPNTDEGEDARLYRDVQLRLERVNGTMYWRVREYCQQGDKLLSIPLNDCNSLVMYTFNDKLFPETLDFISGSGIIGLYTTFVFLASRVLRGFFSGIYTKIMFDDLPNVDRVLQLCLDIYLVREALEHALEEDLFAKLVFLYRSPETMIKWSRPKEDNNEEQRALPPSR